jgi:glycosyltransferase involved in cell wall biosynthesis
MKPSFTVVICAFNAVQRIGRALDALTNVTYDGDWDVLVVDNASTDGTSQFALRWQDRLAGLRVISESSPGVAHARMRALREVGARNICFVDDDNLLAPDYLNVAAEVLNEHPDVGVVVGRSILFEIAPPPEWFVEVTTCYAVGDQWGTEGLIPNPYAPWGAGTVLRGEAVRQLVEAGFEPVLSGRLGRFQLAGEDGEICLGINLLGWHSFCAPTMVIGHAIEPSRMNLPMLRKTCMGFGLAANAIEVYQSFFQLGLKRQVKRSDFMFGGYVLYRFIRAWVLQLVGGLAAKAGYWSALGSIQGYFLAGLRPSRALKSAFLQERLNDFETSNIS